ncbi:hypothetical protein ACTJKH_01985 [Microbacterium sp. 22215]|uniref:hypothetical protein n=1 Tax=Microbacterium sp. 22215 TaxID=3453893 RepID=UPI003F86E93C
MNIAAVPAIDPTLTDIVIPSAAILVSAAIAFVALRIQLGATRRDRRSDAIGRVASSISHILGEAGRKRGGENVDLEPAFSAFDAAIIQLTIAVRAKDRVTVGVIRDQLFMAYLNQPADVEATGWVVRTELEQWAIGNMKNREFRKLAAWGAHYRLRLRVPVHGWDELIRAAEVGPDITPEVLAKMTRNRERMPRAWRDQLSDHIFQWWYQR